MRDIGIFVGGEHIGSFTPCHLVTEKEKHRLEMEYYMRRGNKVFLRNSIGQKLQFETSEIVQDIKDLKYGTKLICEFTLE